MRNYILTTVCCLFLQHAFSQSCTLSSYCNDVFEFCVFFPYDFFDAKNAIENKSGVLIKSQKHDYQLNIIGISDTGQWSMEDFYYFQFENKLTTSAKNQLLDLKLFPEKLIVESFMDGQKHYYEALRSGDYFIVIHLTVPIYINEEEYRGIINSIGIANFPVEE